MAAARMYRTGRAAAAGVIFTLLVENFTPTR
jgi:hypothetical protein